MIGSTVGKYRIVERLGRGGMGTVYKAIDETLDREVAIKVLNPDLGDTDVLKRFRAEAVTLARLNHPGIATIYELYRHEDELLMVMEFVRGETVHDLSERVGALAPPQAAHICVQVLDALAYAHRAGVVHRDLKPANLMVTETGSIKVMDFGIARVLGTEHFTQGGYMMGTPAYMAPEQVLGREVDGRADLYSVGVVLYKLLSGELPFRADTAIAMIQKQVADPPTPINEFRPDLPPWCAEVIDRALAKSPSARFQRAEDFKAMLLAVGATATLGELPTLATPTPPGISVGTKIEPEEKSTLLLSPAAGVPARRHDRTTTTVVLGRTHLLALAAVLVVLLAGIGALGYAAFLRSVVPEAPAAQASDSAAAADQQGDPPASQPAEPGSQAAPESQEQAVAATAGSVPAEPAPKPELTRTRAASSEPAGVEKAKTATPLEESPAPRDPAADAVVASFEDVHVVVSEEGKLREREGVLRLGDGRVTLIDRKAGVPIASVPYDTLTGAFYSRSKQPRWRDSQGRELVSEVDLGRFGFLKSERNWLILTTANHSLLIRFEDEGLRTLLPEVQQRTGRKIQR